MCEEIFKQVNLRGLCGSTFSCVRCLCFPSGLPCVIWMCTEARDGDDPASKSVTRAGQTRRSNELEFCIIFARENFQCARAVLLAGLTDLANGAMERPGE